MTILEALKKIKHLDRKIVKTSERISKWCSYIDTDGALYNAEDVRKMIQSVNDLIAERNFIRSRIHTTNILTPVTFRDRTMTIDELIILATLTIPASIDVQKLLRRKEKLYQHPKEAKVILQYDPTERDKEIDQLEDMLDEANALLDKINITTNLVD